ncbi:MAG: hypothetical protein ACLGQW_04480 [Acidobacteriota bacterium]
MAASPLTPEEEAQKRFIYESIPPRRRKFIDKLGYDNWDPFQKPFEPIDMRIDTTKRTSQRLMNDFIKSVPEGTATGTDYSAGAWEMCVGVVNNAERFRGMYDFVLWYSKLLDSEKGL